jgi:16S rRNA (cytidine1402-2'-O)-methyltransferase
MVFYEAPHKLLSTLEDMAEAFGAERPISLCRELTKLHEEVVRTTLGQAIDKYNETPPKGEFVLVVAGAPAMEEEVPTAEDAGSYVAKLMEKGMSRKDAIKQTVLDLKLPKNVVYEAALKIDEKV